MGDARSEQLEIMTDDGVRLSVWLDGSAPRPPLVLASSLGTTAEMWHAQLTALTPRFRVIRYDPRGHGKSQHGKGPYSIERLGRDVVAILDVLGVSRAHFAGVSLGGMVGQWLGCHSAERIERLVLANTSSYMGPPSSWNARIETVTTRGMSAIAGGMIERWFTPEFRVRAPATVDTFRAMLVATSPAGYVASCAAIRDMDQRTAVAAIRAPTLIVAGAADVATPPAASYELARAISGSRLVTLEAAHLSNVEQPAAFDRALVEFLS
jgi:3-oxoadipate enol-lactonase